MNLSGNAVISYQVRSQEVGTPSLDPNLADIPLEILLHILSYLDLPDLASLSKVSVLFAYLAKDPVLHRTRLRLVAPSRIAHSLFAKSPMGIPFRPTVSDLVQRNILRGLQIERRWRMGVYFYSPHSVKQYESGLRLQRRHTKYILSAHLRGRGFGIAPLQKLHRAQVYPDVESSSPRVSRTLLPVVRQLKWSIQRDRMAKIIRESAGPLAHGGLAALGGWIERQGPGIVPESERVRLALCPDVRKVIAHYELLGLKQ